MPSSCSAQGRLPEQCARFCRQAPRARRISRERIHDRHRRPLRVGQPGERHAVWPDEIILDERRVELLDQQLAASPYHHETLHMPLAEAEQLVRDVTTSANDRAQSALSSLLEDLAPAKCRGIAIRVPPLPDLPATVKEVHANAWIMNRADGMIYHQALTQAAAQLTERFLFREGQRSRARGASPRDNRSRSRAPVESVRKTPRTTLAQRSARRLRGCDPRASIAAPLTARLLSLRQPAGPRPRRPGA